MGISRRDFLKLGGGSIAALAGAGLLGQGFLGNAENGVLADTKAGIVYKPGVCGICEMACAFNGKIEGGRLVKLEGNPLDQHSRGSLCAKGNAGLNMLYDPDRLKAPMLKTASGRVIGRDPAWKQLSWDDAIENAAAEIQKAIDNYGPQSVIWIGHHKGNDFLKAIGSPNDINHQSTCNAVRQLATKLTLGAYNYVPDLENTKYMVCFGWDQLGKGKNSLARAAVAGKTENGAKLVVFDPRFSTTASKADEWIPIRPGTDTAVVLAMLNVIISENLQDQSFVDANVHGFAELAAHVEQYTPEWAAQISDVPTETIIRIAREFAGSCSAVIPIHKREAIQSRPGGFELVRACLSMMAITGNVEVEGGLLIPRVASLSYPRSPKKAEDIKVTERVDGGHLFPVSVTRPLIGPGLYQSVPDMILADEPYPVKVAIVYGQGLQSMPNPEKWIKAFEKLDYLININIYPDDMATLADLVLPEHCYLETEAISARTTNAKYKQVAIGEPMIKPLYDTKSVYEMKHLIAAKMGLKDYLPPHGEKALDYKLKNYKLKYKDAIKKGGLITGKKEFIPKDLTSLKTESGKIQIYSPSLKELGYEPLPWFDEKWILKPEADDEFYITTTRPPMHRHAKTHNMRWLHEMMPEGGIYINASRALSLGIKDGDEIELQTVYGSDRGKARVTQGIRPDTLSILHGFGEKSPLMKLAANGGINDGEIQPAFPKENSIELRDPVGASMDCHVIVKARKV